VSAVRWRIAASAAVVSVLAAACGGSGSDSPKGTAGPAGPTAVVSQVAAACPPSAGLGDNVKDHGSAPAPGAAITLEAGDSFFAPTCETGVPAGKVTITLKNTGSALHNFSVADQGIDVDVEAGKTISVEVDATAPSVAFFCKYHRTSGMVGALLQGPG
jgi:plastocyanin